MKDIKIVIDRDRLYSTLPPLLAVLVYGMVLYGGGSFLGTDGQDLCLLLQVEFLVIHSFPFLCLFAWFRKLAVAKLAAEGKEHRAWVWGASFWGLLALYIGASFSMGWAGPLYFLSATAATYLGFWFKRMEPDALAQLGIRWVASFIFYLVCTSIFDLSNSVNEWSAEPETYRAGFSYFLILAGLEAFDVYSWLGPKLKKMWMSGYVGPRMPGPGPGNQP